MNDPAENWQVVVNDKSCNIEKKENKINPNPILRTTATIDGYTAREIFDAIAVIQNRLKWDTNFSEMMIVDENEQDRSQIMYMVIKVT
jgi:hypothetical protein